MKRKAKHPEGIGNILNKVIKKIEDRSPDKKERILNIWKKAAKEKAASHSRPINIKRKILIIEVDSSTWLYDLSLKRKNILNDIKKELGEDKIKDIKFRMGDIS